MNKVQLIGNVGRDPEVRNTNGGARVVSFSIATSERWKDQAGERKERTEWHNVVVFNENIGKVIEQYVKKGSKIFVEGQMQTRKWTDNAGVEKYTTEVVLRQFRGEVELLSSSGNGRPAPEPDAYGTTRDRPREGSASAPPAGGGGRGNYDLDDDIPF